MTTSPPAEKIKAKPKLFSSLFLVFAFVSIVSGSSLEFTGVLKRAELQTIDQRFEARCWMAWTPEGLSRLNPKRLIDYHEKHEIPRHWWCWDYTLSWLIQPNHIPVKKKFVIFNHLLEDEPPLEALADHPWMTPLMQFPVSRATLAKSIEFLNSAGARLIILDNDFPQYSKDDVVLAEAIHKSEAGAFTGRKVPVLMASTVNHRSFANIMQLDFPSAPSGILACLQRLEPGFDPAAKYTGSTSMLLDEDQVVRRMLCRASVGKSAAREPLVLKALSRLGEEVPASLPDEMDIDFAGPPNSELYPVRPFSYLLDPDLQKRITNHNSESPDASVENAIVILGDGVTDLYPTPYTNLGVNLMSGPEILAQAFDTILRRSWHYRVETPWSYLYLAMCSISSAALLCLWKRVYSMRFKQAQNMAIRLALDLSCCIFMLGLSYFVACLLFCHLRLIVPVVAPASSLIFAFLASALWERENQRLLALKQKLEHAEELLILQQEKHDEEMRRQLAESQMQEIVQDQQRRGEFVRKINHDLKAPVTAMSWILARLMQGGLSPAAVSEKIERLAKTSNRLVDLLHELAHSYETGTQQDEENYVVDSQLNRILFDCVSMARPLAEMKGARLELSIPERKLWVKSNPLKISRIFDNLIRNAVLHNPSGTQIQVEARSRAHVHQIYVSDNGKGMDADMLLHLFEKKELRPGGTDGLGLQIVYAFIESMGGKITVTSEPGHGTTFTVTLPSSHLEAGGESGDDIFSTGQHKVIQA